MNECVMETSRADPVLPTAMVQATIISCSDWRSSLLSRLPVSTQPHYGPFSPMTTRGILLNLISQIKSLLCSKPSHGSYLTQRNSPSPPHGPQGDV